MATKTEKMRFFTIAGQKKFLKLPKILKREVSSHGAFLKKLRDDPRFQEDVVRRELGYATDEETTFRFSEK